LEANSKRETIPLEGLWDSIAECSDRSDLQTLPSAADDNLHLIKISGWCPRVRMGRQSVDPSQYIKASECTIKKPDGRLHFEFEEDSVSIDRHDLTQTQWENCVIVLIGSTENSHINSLTLQDNNYVFVFLILCTTSEKEIYERVGIFDVLLEHTSSRVSHRSGDKTPDWDEDWCDDGYTIEELDSIDDILIDGSKMTHDIRQRLYRTQEDRADDYDFGKDPYRFIEEPEETFEDDFVLSWSFPDWETRVFIVRKYRMRL
jgi:hypothetical protein